MVKGQPDDCQFMVWEFMQGEEVRQVEMLVNQWIQEEHTLEVREVPIAEAKAAGIDPAKLSSTPSVCSSETDGAFDLPCLEFRTPNLRVVVASDRWLCR